MRGIEAKTVTPVLLYTEGEAKSSKPAGNNSMVTACALFDKTGDLVFVGQSKGTITVVDANSLRFVDMIKVLPCRTDLPIVSEADENMPSMEVPEPH